MKVSDLRGILQYVPRFRERIFVIALDGEIIGSENFPNILLDVAVLRSLSIKVVLVHGTARQVEKLAAERGAAISNSDGTGVTDDATLQVSIDAATRTTHAIMEGLSAVDLRAGYANAVIAHPAGIIGGIDYQHTGKVEKVDAKILNVLLDQGVVPVVPPLAFDGEGKTFRVNSDAIALEVGEALHAAKIIFMLAQDDLCREGKLIRQLSISEAEDLVKTLRAPDCRNLASKLDHAARACRSGIPRVHLLDGKVDEALLTELFSNEGIGTMIYSNEYQQIRRVYKKDVRAVMALIRQSVRSEELIRRTRADILQRIDDYWVLEIDRNLVGCVALHVHPEESKAEMACLYVHKNRENEGYGRMLMAFSEKLAREKHVKHLFALSTQAFSYLEKKGGYVEAAADFLPSGRREKYDASGRKSKVLRKDLGASEPLRTL